jgi:hypothetical protein
MDALSVPRSQVSKPARTGKYLTSCQRRESEHSRKTDQETVKIGPAINAKLYKEFVEAAKENRY